MAKELAKGYEPQKVEERIYRQWEENGCFKADPSREAESYCIVIPPPNVTGALHMGHALNNTIQDMLIRYKRMDGYNTLWQPGTDHAGIATQNVVERQLAAEGTDRHQVGREKFIERVWEWKEDYGGRILNQLKRLGASCDWDRERFTMDEGLSRAVRQVFVTLYDQGLIYKGDYITNWCPRCLTALADLEVEHHDVPGALHYVKYPLADGSGALTVATTRPETMFGDTAVAVNPEDDRFAKFIGKEVRLPLTDRVIPVIADDHVDVEFGTGALKITPGHDPNDFEIGQRHNLDVVRAMDDHGIMTEAAGPYAGLDRDEARKKVIEDLEAGGYLDKIEPYNHSVGHCYRCRTMIEPLVSTQWFVKIKPLADRAIEAVRSGRTKIVPPQWEKTYYEWMENIRDWCISRQLWWGHRIPAWYCADCGKMIVSMDDPEACSCGGKLTQETDVLDTWFSSGLWPFSTLGWPDQTDYLKTFYPTSCLVTGFDILFFWVARMMMLGLWFLDEVPFDDVYIHALVRDEHGAKMSKSKGNVIDPLEVVGKYGADSFRFTLAAFAAQGRDVKLSMQRIEGYRNFINKVWNAARFALLNLDGYDPKAAKPEDLSPADRWILSRLNETIGQVRQNLDGYYFDKAASALYQFTWHELCDWYIELAKPNLSGRNGEEAKAATQWTIHTALASTLKLLHPIIPFVTEEIWSHLPGCEGYLMLADFPKQTEAWADPEAEAAIQQVQDACLGIRNIRGEFNIPPTQRVKAIIFSEDAHAIEVINAHRDDINNLAWTEDVVAGPPGDKPDQAAAAVVGSLEIFLPLAGLIDFKEEEKRLTKELAKVEKDLKKTQGKLGNKGFLDKAPAEVVDKEKAKLAEMTEKKDKLIGNLDQISKFV